MRSRAFLGFLALLALLVGLMGVASPSLAQGRWAHDRYYSNVQPLQQILPGIRRGYPGRFYDAEGPFPDGAGGLHYRIKWMTPEGRIIWLDTDARTGRVIGPARVAGADRRVHTAMGLRAAAISVTVLRWSDGRVHLFRAAPTGAGAVDILNG